MAEATKTAEKIEKKTLVTLFNDFWDDNGERIRTNIPVLDDSGNPKMDPKTKQPITRHVEVELPNRHVRTLVAAGKAQITVPLED